MTVINLAKDYFSTRRFSFREARNYLGPKWLVDPNTDGGLVGYCVDLIQDAFMERVFQGHMARFPHSTSSGAPGVEDAVLALGRDRRLTRGIDETISSYADRLPNWLVERRSCGNPFTLMRQLRAYLGGGSSFLTVDDSGNWYAVAADGTETSSVKLANWDWDSATVGAANLWSRFWVVVYPGTRWSVESTTWGTGSWGDDGVLGMEATSEQVLTTIALVSEWKPAGTTGSIIVAFDTASFSPTAPEPDGKWGKWYKYSAGTAVPSRLSTARYIGV